MKETHFLCGQFSSAYRIAEAFHREVSSPIIAALFLMEMAKKASWKIQTYLMHLSVGQVELGGFLCRRLKRPDKN
jgi:hypothetical protein